MSKFRSVRKVLPRPSPHVVGDNLKVYPVFADSAFTNELSPFLMFDYAEPREHAPRTGDPFGVGMHPHRGFETVTVAFQGEIEHLDSKGNSGIIKPGDVQWMTAGKGILHQEHQSKEFTKRGGTEEMCQLWVNLPKEHKMTKPNYQGILNQEIPVVNIPAGTEGDNVMGSARLIAGELSNVKGAANTFSPVQVWDVSLPNADSEVDIPFPADHNCIIFVRRGSVDVMSGSDDDIEATKLGLQNVALLDMDGSGVLRLRVNKSDSSVLILGGEPLDEPIAARGPFVMNTDEELYQAMVDFRTGNF